MPNFNGTGPEGAGPMTGRGCGFCGGGATMMGSPNGRGNGMGNGPSRGMGRGMGRGNGPGCGFGAGYGRGLGRGAGWFSVGYDRMTAGTDMNNALEQKRDFLLAELARTEALLGEKSATGAAQANKEAEK